MNESETRAELIDPELKRCGWGVVPDSRILRERQITDGKLRTGGKRSKALIADYILVYKGMKLAVVEAKKDELEVGEGVAQAKQYAEKLKLETAYSTNGKEIYQICMKTGKEGLVKKFLTPEELWNKTYPENNETETSGDWRDRFAEIPFETKSGTWKPRYYQEIAIRSALEAIAKGKKRILLTLATGTGKTAIAFQIAWKLFQTRWNLNQDGKRRPRILFLADRNILADQAFNSFSAFPEDAMIRIKPEEIKKKGRVPTNGSIFFTIFQTFMTESARDERNDEDSYDLMVAEPVIEFKSLKYNFGQYPSDYFDFIIIDECHRGGANNESEWRGILDYFTSAVQLGLTATPKRRDNVDTYQYFGEPVYIYSLKDGINDGFLTPFKVKRIKTTLDDYMYTNDDIVLEGEVEERRLYKEHDFNRNIEIIERERKRVNVFMANANENDKTIIFCAKQEHAALVRDIVNQRKKNKNVNYCVRVTANDGEIGERFLREFQDNEKMIPTILTTSQKLSTGVDARNIRNIVLMRPVNQIIEFKQIIGRGTRLYDGKDFFTIYDFVNAYERFSDPEWDGEPIPEICSKCGESPCTCEKTKKLCPVCGEKPCVCPGPEPKVCEVCGQEPCTCSKKVKIKLRDGKEREIQHMISTSYWDADGTPVSSEEFLNNILGELPNLFKDEEELRKQWSDPRTRKNLLEKLEDAGYGKEELNLLKKIVDAENSDIYDVLEYLFNGENKPATRAMRVAATRNDIYRTLNDSQKEFIDYVLEEYIKNGVSELSQDKLPILITNKYQTFEDAREILGEVIDISNLFINFQHSLYEKMRA